MSELSTPEWNAKILKALKANSRRFVKTAKAKSTPKRQAAPARRTLRPTKARER